MVALGRLLVFGYAAAAAAAATLALQTGLLAAALLLFWIGGAIVTLGLAICVAGVAREEEAVGVEKEIARSQQLWENDRHNETRAKSRTANQA